MTLWKSKYGISFIFQVNMLQKVSLTFLLCVLQLQFYRSRYVLIDLDDEASGVGAGCGEFCIVWGGYCTDPKCPFCWTPFVFGFCTPWEPPCYLYNIQKLIHYYFQTSILLFIVNWHMIWIKAIKSIQSIIIWYFHFENAPRLSLYTAHFVG